MTRTTLVSWLLLLDELYCSMTGFLPTAQMVGTVDHLVLWFFVIYLPY